MLARVKTDQAGPYDVIVSNPSGSVTSLVATLTVNITAGTPAITTQPQSRNVRVGESTTFSVTASGTVPLLYQWYEGIGGDTSRLIAGATKASYTAPSLSTNTSFWVSVHNSLGTVDSETATVRVFPANAAKLDLRMISGLPGLTIDGLPGTIYRVEYSTNLTTTNWTKAIDLSLPSSPFTFIDLSASGANLRLYRVQVP